MYACVICCWQEHRNIPKSNCSKEVYCEEQYWSFLLVPHWKSSPKNSKLYSFVV